MTTKGKVLVLVSSGHGFFPVLPWLSCVLLPPISSGSRCCSSAVEKIVILYPA